ncbi:tenascin-X isoform X2 [Pseudophryne corroboree]|uniref:tenascin-X isoform X2 n=1 Tax=Pseudophryne corroboree TaxID=495146 RepID=UPI0030820DE2
MNLIPLSLVFIFFGGSLSAPPSTTQPKCPQAEDVQALLKRLIILEKLVRDIKGQCTTPCCGKAQSDADNPANVKSPACNQENNDCPGGCGGDDRGTCVNGECQCKDGYMGDRCQLLTCPEDCNDQGHCVKGTCICFKGYFGVSCGSKGCPKNCQNRGRCEDGLCVCDPGFTGEDCSSRTCPKNCMNQGKCEGGVCVCFSGFTGPDCGTKACPRNCLNRGKCENGVCACRPGFSGVDCGSRSCPNNCQGRGDCEDGVCVCDTGFTGVDCGSRSCLNDCNRNGECEDGVCVCHVGFYGEDCGYKACPDDCNEQGQCIAGKCVCDPGFVGLDCGIRICSPECERRGRCEDGECICDPGFSGPDCEIRTCPNDCHNQGRCDDGKCVCNLGYTGLDCKSRTCPNNCQNRGQCVDGTCICNAGFSGPDCGTKACPKNCSGNGQCVNGKCICNSGFSGPVCGIRTCPAGCTSHGRCLRGTCVCSPGYTGVDCSIRTCPKNCHNRGSCEGGVCFCDSGFTGLDCGTKTCPSDCFDRGHCEDGVCVCDYGFTGHDCGSRTCPNDCNNRGQCEDGVCVCNSGYTGQDCVSRTCPRDCHNRGQCEDGVCACEFGYTGIDCGSRTCPKDCNNRGRCEDGQCICAPGYTDDDCGTRTCPDNCNDNGRCDDGKCICDAGYTGLDCGSKTCPNDCNNRGQCEDGICQCNAGYTDIDCGLKTCPNDCQNRGQCDDGVCVCDSGYSGQDCGSRTCPENCNDRGRCDDGKCICDSGFAGVDCGSRSCPDNCHVHGRCQEGVCICNPGYTGPDCGSKACPKNCNNNGQCVNGKCICNTGFGGPVCGAKICPGNCSGQGKCTNGVCVCKKGYSGPDCAVDDTEVTEVSAVSGLRVTSHEESTVTLEWDQPQMPPDSYDITFKVKKENGVISTTISGSLVTYHQTGLAPGEEYHVTIQPRKGSTLAPETSITATTRIETPRGFRITEVAYTSLLLRWERPNFLPDRYVVTLVPPIGKERKLRVPGKGDRIRVTGLEEGTEYRILLRAEKGLEQSQDAEITGTTAGEERKRPGAEHVTHGSVGTSHNVDTSGILESSIKETRFHPTLPNTDRSLLTKEIKEILTEDPKGSSVIHTTKNIKTIITTIYETHHREDGSMVDVYRKTEDSEYPSTKPPHGQDKLAVDNVRIEGALENVREFDRRDKLPGIKLESWIFTTNVTDFDPSTKESSISWHEAETEVSPHPKAVDRMPNIHSKVPVPGSGRLPDTSSVAKKLLEFESSKMKPVIKSDKDEEQNKSHPERVSPSENINHRLPLSGSGGLLDSSKTTMTEETSKESISETGGPGVKSGENTIDVPADPSKTRKHITTLVKVNKIVTTTKIKGAGREDDKYFHNVTTVVEGLDGTTKSAARTKNQTRAMGHHMKSVIENLPEKLSIYNGTFIQRLESYLRATSYPLKVNQTVESVAQAIFLYLVKWKPHSFTGMVYERLPQKTPGASENSEPIGSSRLQGNMGIPVNENRIPSNTSTGIHQPQGGSVLLTKPDSATTISIAPNLKTLGRVEAVGDIATPMILTVGKHSSTSEVTEENLDVRDKVSKDPSKTMSEVDPSKTLPSKPLGDKSKVSQKRLPPPKKATVPKEKMEQKENDKGEKNVEEEKMSTGSLDKEYDISSRISIFEISTIKPTEKVKSSSTTHSGNLNIDEDETLERSTLQSHLHQNVKPESSTEIFAKGLPNYESKLIDDRMEEGSVISRKRPTYPRKTDPNRQSPNHETALLHSTAPPTPQQITVTTQPPSPGDFTTSSPPVTKRPIIPPLGGLQVRDVTSDTVTLVWKARTGVFESFLIRYEDVTDSAGPKEVSVPGDQREMTLQNLSQNTRYGVSLYGIRGGKLSRPLTEEVTTDSSPDRGTPPRLSPLSVSEVRPDSFRLTWEPLEGDFDAFILQYGPPEGPLQEETLRGDQTSWLITGLVAEVNYTVELRGIWGESNSEPEFIYVFTEKPQPPRLESLSLSDVRSDSVHLSWEVKGGDFESFLLYYRDGEGRPQEITLEEDLRSFDVKNLKPGKKYKFVLYGIDGGKRSKPVTAETTTEKYLPPHLQSLSVSDVHSESVRLSWLVDGGEFDSFLLLYRNADGKPMEISLDGEQRSLAVEDLKPGKKYKFILYGISAGKKSKAVIAETSTAPIKVTPSPVPRLVDLVSSEVTKESVKLSWRVEGNLLFDWIIVQYRDPEGGVRELQIAGEDTSTVVQGLLPSRKYDFSVYGLRGEKRSKPLSTEIETGFLEAVGSPILNDLYISPHGPHNIQLSWEVPEGTFDSFTVRYGIQGQDGSVKNMTTAGSERALLLSGLQPDTVYTVTLHGVQDQKEHSSLEGTGKTAPLDLESPRNLKFSNVEETSATVSWEPPSPDTTTFKVSYQLADGGEPESVNVVGTSTPLKGLIPGTHYEVTVVTVRGFEESQPLTDFFTTVGGGPRSLRAHDVTEVSALLRWEPSRGLVDRYLVTYRAENIPLVTLVVPGDRTELPLAGLHPHTEYFVSVQSSQGSMTSTPTSTSFTTSADTPRDLSASQITARSCLLTWKAPDAVPDGYLLTYQTPQGEMKEIHLLPHLYSFTMSQLNPITQYRVQLHALRNGASSAPISTSFTTGRLRFPYPRDCWEQRMNGEVQNGTFSIYLSGDKEKTLTVYCDMETDGGGWIVFQRRMDGSTEFYRDWEDYRNGFGNLTSEFWLGNIALHQISSSAPHELRVDLRAGEEAAYAVYDDFRVEDERQHFRLRLGQYRGNAGDSMNYHNNMVFSTRDRDTQKRILPCAMSYRGAWWYRNCHYANLNGMYSNNKDHQGVNWYTWKGFEFSIPFTEMKMRPRRAGNQRRL